MKRASTSRLREGSVRQSALPGAGEHLQPDRACDGRGGVRRARPYRSRARARRWLRQPLDHSRRPFAPRPARAMCNTRSSAAAPARAPARTARRAHRSTRATPRSPPIEIIESEFPTRVLRFELIEDSGGAGEFRGGLGIRREYLNLADARFSIRSTKHVIAPHGAAGGGDGRTGDIIDQSRQEGRETPADALCRLSAEGRRRVPARYAGRRRLRGPARARSGARARGRARGLCFA